MAKKKVLVGSIYNEVMARTGVKYIADETVPGGVRSIDTFRQFREGKCWMTPEEAEFLVESEENKRYLARGFHQPYFYPAGFPAALDGKDLEPPLTGDVSQFIDPRAVEAAQKIKEQIEAAKAESKKRKAERDLAEATKATA